MSRAQLHKSLKAFGHPPIAEQAAKLALLQRELEEAEHGLATLAEREPAASAPLTPVVDKAAMNRAKVQLAVRRAALKKAQASAAPADEMAALAADIAQAEQELSAFAASAMVIPSP